MKEILTKRPTLALLIFAVACLASAVFLWGTEYKVSLYPKHHKTQQAVPIAKLLSERERPAVAAEAPSRADALALTALFSLTLLTVLPVQKDSAYSSSQFPLRRRDSSIQSTIFVVHLCFRPPPTAL